MNKYGFSAEEIKASNPQLMKHMLASLPGESPMQHSREDGLSEAKLCRSSDRCARHISAAGFPIHTVERKPE
jgi:hypothetical protein